jgi:hypothetical protein
MHTIFYGCHIPGPLSGTYAYRESYGRRYFYYCLAGTDVKSSPPPIRQTDERTHG